MNRVAITGASGFISTYLVRRLVKLGVEVRCLGRRAKALDHLPGDLKVIPTGYNEDLIEILSGVDTIFHMAGRRSTKEDNPLDFADSIGSAIQGFNSILRASALNSVKRIVHASSIAVYSERNCAPYIETELLTPATPYGLMKLVSEQVGSFWSRETGVPVAHARLAQCYGHREKTSPALMTLMQRAAMGRMLTVQKGGTFQIDQLYVEDAVRALIRIAESNYAGPVNIGAGIGYSVREIAEAANIVYERAGNLTIEPVENPPSTIVQRHMDIGKAERTLAWRPEFSLQQGLFAMKAEANAEMATAKSRIPTR